MANFGDAMFGISVALQREMSAAQRLAAQQSAQESYYNNMSRLASINDYKRASVYMQRSDLRLAEKGLASLPQDQRPQWLKDAHASCGHLRRALEDAQITSPLEWQTIKHDLPLLEEAYRDAPEAPEVEQAALALIEAARRGMERAKERRTMRGVSAALALLWRVGRMNRVRSG